MSSSEDTDRSLLINPNIGHPIFLKIDSNLKTINFQTNILYVSDIEDIKEFRESIKYDLKLVPILEYKWKLRSILRKHITNLRISR